MAEGIKRKIMHSGTTKAALETAKLAIAPTAQAAITASDILLTGGLSIPTEWALKKLVRKAQGVGEADFITPFGVVKITGKFKTLPDGRRILVKKIDEVVTKPSPYYKQKKRELDILKKMERGMYRVRGRRRAG
jgi:hypothetical protein